MRFITANEEETRALACSFGRSLDGGSIVLAYGTLGAGKTCFAQGLALGVGIDKKVNSPTFNIIKEYVGKDICFYHIDAYRLEDVDAISDIGFEDILGDSESIAYIEWPEFIQKYLKDYKKVYKVSIEVDEKTGYRTIEIEETK